MKWRVTVSMIRDIPENVQMLQEVVTVTYVVRCYDAGQALSQVEFAMKKQYEAALGWRIQHREVKPRD